MKMMRIRTLMEKVYMEDHVLKQLSFCGSRPKQGETEGDLIFRRMMSCWFEKKDKSYQLLEVLKIKMKEVGLKVDINGQWAKPFKYWCPTQYSNKIRITKT
ncbi:unnamed protein product [Paramecium octaurelia]|uniref:Uncharacterized protein n=1 Tax=Paramecium octaurelia TaxID=43137 RepID=A0A8S1VNA3_PAROT|nr:unnamed protein product [Paramecium octaurelia]